MLETLNSSPMLMLFIVVALGSVVGAIPIGPLRFGAAGALFAGLVVGAFVPDVGSELALLKDFGLALFAYLIGLTAGQTFFKDLVKSFPLMLGSVIVVIISAVAAVIGARILGMSPGLAAGVFSGALTSTPSMALAEEITGSTDPAVGYSIGYLVGVVAAILLLAAVPLGAWTGRKDPAQEKSPDLEQRTVRVMHPMPVRDVPGAVDGTVNLLLRRRRRVNRVISAADELKEGDLIIIDGPGPAVAEAIRALGEPASQGTAQIRGTMRERPYVLSASNLAGQTIGSLNMQREFGAVVSRVRREDEEFLATDDLPLQLGDQLLVVAPSWRLDGLRAFFGHSTRSLSTIDWMALGGGLALGYALALIEIPVPGGNTFALGSAAGTLIAGLILGAVGRTRGTLWHLPPGVNLTLREFGLMMFLGAVGLSSGPAFMSTVLTPDGLYSAILALAVSIIGCGLMVVCARLLGQSVERSYGAVAGLLGQPAVLDFATARTDDGRVMAGYAQIFAIALILKIFVIPFML